MGMRPNHMCMSSATVRAGANGICRKQPRALDILPAKGIRDQNQAAKGNRILWTPYRGEHRIPAPARIFVRGCASSRRLAAQKKVVGFQQMLRRRTSRSQNLCVPLPAPASQFCKRWRGAGPPFRTETGACRALNGNGGPRIETVPGGAAAKTCGDLCRERAGRRVVNY